MNETLPPISKIESVADALVLTEWKLVKKDSTLNNTIKSAQKQVDMYSSGVLGGIEFTNYRYLVMVSKRKMEMSDDDIQGPIIYRHINIAVDPSAPSIEAKIKKNKQ